MHFNVARFGKSGKIFSLLALVMVLALTLTASNSEGATWLLSGQGRTNWRYQPLESTISAQNAGNLAVKWSKSGGDVSATPSVSDGIVYYPDWNGSLNAVNADTGAVIWQDNLATVSGIAGAVSRTTPTINGNVLFVGLQNQGWLLAIQRNNGALIWKTQLDTNPAAIISQSPAYFKGVLYVGMSSSEESFAADPNYVCCTFRGSVSAVDEKTGQVLWKTYTVPAGYTGASVWGSTPVVDPSRKLVYVTTGNNYTLPAGIDGSNLSPADYVDAILALDINTGKVAWADPHLGLPTGDTWTVACFTDQPGYGNCPDPAGPDYDFGQGVMEVKATINGKEQTLVIAGQKSGKLWALNADTGQTVWMYDSGVGSALGGMEWGSATDGKTVYFANSAGDFWGAVDIATGQLKWKTSDPNPVVAPFYANDVGPVSVANGVVYAGSLAGSDGTRPSMFAMDANTGQILWQFVSGGSVGGGPSIVNGMVFWGNGYGHGGIGAGAGANDFYAFSLK